MKIIDIVNQKRVNRKPDKTIVLMSSGDFLEHGFIVKKIELKLYLEKKDEKLGQYSLITSIVETDKGSVEMIYDEGFRGENALEKAADFVTKNLGLSGLITRSIITLQSNL